MYFLKKDVIFSFMQWIASLNDILFLVIANESSSEAISHNELEIASANRHRNDNQ